LYRDARKTTEISAWTENAAPWCIAHRDKFQAKVPGLVDGWAAPPTLTAHTRWPLVQV